MLFSLSPETNYPDYKPNNENADGKGEETNVIDEADRRDVDKPDVYFESNANEAEEVRLNRPGSRGLNGDLAGDEADGKNSKNLKKEVGQTRVNSKKQKNATLEALHEFVSTTTTTTEVRTTITKITKKVPNIRISHPQPHTKCA